MTGRTTSITTTTTTGAGIAFSYMHPTRVVGQGYCDMDDVTEEISSNKSDALEEYLRALEFGETPDATTISSQDRAMMRKINKWITKWSNYADDRIRVKYRVPFPDAPYSPESLRIAVTYFVVHNIYVYQGLYRGNEEEDENSYYGMAERILEKIVQGETVLKTEYQLPLVDKDGKVVGYEEVKVGLTGNIIASHSTDNPMSMRNQDREFGYPVRSRFGGSGYRQDGDDVDSRSTFSADDYR